MSLPLIKKQFIKHGLAVATASIMASTAYAGTNEQQEIQQLRAEVAELRALIQQQAATQKQIVAEQKARPVVVASAPAVVVAQAPATPAPANAKPGWLTLPDGQTQVKLYGNVRVDAAYDFKGTTGGINNKTGQVPLNKDNPTEDSLNVSAAPTRIGLDIARQTDLGELTGKIEADFWGDGTSNGDGKLRIRHAYASLGKWLAGQTTSPFVNTDTSPDLIDFTGPMGGGTQRNVQVRYTQPIDANQKVLVALEGGDVENGKTAGGSRFPALTARYDIKTSDSKGLLQVHGLAHENRVSTNDSNDEEKWGWGLGVGGKYQFTPKDAIMANYYHVKGDSRYILYSGQTNTAYTTTGDGKTTDYDIHNNEFDTAQIGYQRNWSPKLRSAFSLAGMWFKDDNTYAENNQSYNKTLYNAIANIIYTPVKNVDLGAEYTYGQRETFAGDKGDLSRINFLTRYSF
ncbi:hypothetical protein F943_01312 [Acinetobacter ursingii NIPH 706]|uniref:DcaP family trimeric outer membrane transporter n=1 Tax=Acinetobacter TaxID=469 RepID=UPI0002CDB0D9|nr:MULTISPECIES: DcaP family trimeric outer membrane transporter [Acinetobacter]ENX48919.1 hypothetical protein F943_01312 [Acinetobacter ursingii NIPH 706]EXD34632.1 hypothetical protein J500_2292 [Acinetobacter sp. 479375]MCH2016571.1 porin [Acinetobacter ursingii]RSC22083.1 DcaP-like protein [Acinetobacter sp. FDAARGOS_515]RSO81745.1 DcaP-like protein [Acinetobacter ursingii]